MDFPARVVMINKMIDLNLSSMSHDDLEDFFREFSLDYFEDLSDKEVERMYADFLKGK